MKKTILILTTSIAASVCASAQEVSQTEAVQVVPETPCATSDCKQADTSTLFGSFPKLSEEFSRFSAAVTFAYESEYVFRGKHVTGSSLMPEVDFGYDLGSGFAIYTGVWSAVGLDGSDFKEVDYYTGVTYTYDFLTAELGYAGYSYPSSDERSTNESKLGFSIDTTEWLGDFNVSPFVAYYYDFNRMAHTIEAGASWAAPVTKWVIGQEWGTVNLGALYGWSHNGRNVYTDYSRNSYSYVLLTADAVVVLNNYCAVSAGIRYAYNNDYDQNGPTAHRLWFGTSMTIGF